MDRNVVVYIFYYYWRVLLTLELMLTTLSHWSIISGQLINGRDNLM